MKMKIHREGKNILLILFIKYGRSYTESRIAARSWMSSFVW